MLGYLQSACCVVRTNFYRKLSKPQAKQAEKIAEVYANAAVGSFCMSCTEEPGNRRLDLIQAAKRAEQQQIKQFGM